MSPSLQAMEWLVLLSAAVGVVALFRHLTAPAEPDPWRPLADRMGLASMQLAERNGRRLVGEYKGARIEVCEVEESTGGSNGGTMTNTRVVVAGSNIGRGFSLRRCHSGDLTYWFGGAPGLTGDETFDADWRLEGDATMAMAVLTRRARRALSNCEIQNGQLVYKCAGRVKQPQHLIEVVEQCIETAGVLSLEDVDVPKALAANATSDPVPEVRLRNLALLAQGFPETPAARRVAVEALRDADARVRLAAATLTATPDAYACLVSLVGAEQHSFSNESGVPALHHLLDAYPRADLSEPVGAALDSSWWPLQCLAADAIASGQHVGRLSRLLSDPLPSGAQSRLVKMLSSETDACRLAAARALAATGTLEAVEPLLPVAKRRLERGHVRRAARDAILKIQQRTGAVGAGRLSVLASSSLAGGLSLPTLEGSLSVADGTELGPDTPVEG